MKHNKYQKDVGATAAYTKRMMESIKGVSQISIKGVQRIVFFLIVGLPPIKWQKL